ncbi:RNA polymerase sigma factor RpoE [Filimonas lacunae]|nr:RNA polymerase sigma factor RpoE [Filimonas lacunae]
MLAGNQQAFASIVRQTERLVVQIVFKMIPAPGDRQDMIQDIYLKAFSHLATFQFQAKLSTWLGKISYNTCLHYLEKKKLAFLPETSGPEGEPIDALDQLNQQQSLLQNNVEAALSQKQLAAILDTAVKGLSPPIYQTLITLYHQEELSYAEIGEITSLPEGTVKSYLFRARKLLKENLLSRYKKEEL